MAAASTPAPGTTFGPCATPCAHVDCAASRREAAADCRICGELIGYDRPWYKPSDERGEVGPAHASCLEDQIERERQASELPTSITIGGVVLELDRDQRRGVFWRAPHDTPKWHDRSMAWLYDPKGEAHCAGQYGCSIYIGPACVGGVRRTLEELDALVREQIADAREAFGAPTKAAPVTPDEAQKRATDEYDRLLRGFNAKPKGAEKKHHEGLRAGFADGYRTGIAPLREIHAALDGTMWDADTMQAVADVLTRAGFTIAEPHEDDTITSEELADGSA